MAYGNYAPFYRPAFFNPMQTIPIHENANQFGTLYQQPMQNSMQPQPSNDMIWVLNETEATSYPVAPNNTVTLWDKNSPTIYIKSVDLNGVPSMRILDFSERHQIPAKSTQDNVCQCTGKYAPIDELNILKAQFDTLSQNFEDWKRNTTSQQNKNEVKNDGESFV